MDKILLRFRSSFAVYARGDLAAFLPADAEHILAMQKVDENGIMSPIAEKSGVIKAAAPEPDKPFKPVKDCDPNLPYAKRRAGKFNPAG